MLITYIGSFTQVVVLCLINFYLLKANGFMKERLLFIFGIASIAAFVFLYIGLMGIFILVILTIAINYRHTKDKVASTTVPLYSLMILVLSDHLSFLTDIYIFNHTVDSVAMYLPNFLLHLLFFVLFAIMFSFITNLVISYVKQWIPFVRKYSMFLLLLTVLTIAFIYINILISNREGFSREIIQLNSYIFLVYVIFFVSILGILLSSIVKEVKVKAKQEEYRQLRNYSENLEEMYGELQKFRHDYINILASMSEYIRAGNINQLKDYFNEKVLPASQHIRLNNYKLGALKNIKVTEVKGTLVSKLIKAQDSGIDISIEAVDPIEQIKMDSISLCRCLGIILDNAIEETANHENSKITIAFIKKEKSILIVVVNTISGEIPKLSKLFKKGYSTKGENRGIGLGNLKELTSSYENITLETKIEGRQFFQGIEVFDRGA
ncbi:GHKL domain-containing protein [Oceanobacillus piezotolerans]|uniref:GHKL domain-containing protein n=1 Tax=Oceanobacillus piezotolerans TaxID=2448030 RepID=A0A498D3T6_9BACI|nr:GHKL domain-containing protein [Oceanobacillus piezotolerans]RLL42891.1 GHKL domain-containing protein [Oceanobacillus piezotolerans]